LDRRIAGKHVEEQRSVHGNFVPGSKETQVLVLPGGLIVVVSRGKVHVAFNTGAVLIERLFPADNHADLGVNLEPGNAVHHQHPGFFQPVRP
jgi:hypothetical protein